MRTLRELEANFIRYEKRVADKNHGRPMPDGTTQWGGFEVDILQNVETLDEAQGITFLCPQCFNKNGGPVGTHSVYVSFEGRGVPDDAGTKDSNGQPSRWKVVSGTGLDDLILSPSIFLNAGHPGACQWHGFVGMNGVPPGHAY